jgi:hypothetical protein
MTIYTKKKLKIKKILKIKLKNEHETCGPKPIKIV